MMMAVVIALTACLIVMLTVEGRLGDEPHDISLTDDMMDKIVSKTQDVKFLAALKDKRGVTIVTQVKDVTFELYTREGKSVLDLQVMGSKKPPKFRSDRKTKILIHGFLSSGVIYNNTKNGYLLADDYNVIIVDWSGPAECWRMYSMLKTFVCYIEVVNNHISSVGNLLSRLLDVLFTKYEVGNIHIIGHSLGAHIAGIAGAKHKVGRITGLDPASPSINVTDPEMMLTKDDANFVDVIHTCIGTFGWTSPMGHADFYPNRGEAPQHGCKFPTSKICSHSRSHVYFTESVTSNVSYQFAARPCQFQEGKLSLKLCSVKATTVMGERTNTSARGVYYVETGSKSPFAAHKT